MDVVCTLYKLLHQKKPATQKKESQFRLPKQLAAQLCSVKLHPNKQKQQRL
jgi:hypothetical protein